MSCPRHKNNGKATKFSQLLEYSRQGMTYLKTKAEADVDTKESNGKINELTYKKKSPIWLNDHCIQACAWILLTIGLCIIVITFYLAIQQKHNDSPRNVDVADVGFGSGNDGIHLPSNANDVAISLEDNLSSDNIGGKWLDLEQNGRVHMADILGAIASNLNGCQEKLCKIACSHEVHIYASLFKTMKASSCPSIDILLLESQDFPGNKLNNSWVPLNLSVYEVIIQSSNVTRITSNAFNTPMFQNTFLMSWTNLDIEKVESGALLGLYKLKYLTIDSNMQKLEPAFFQPVQTTLTHLKLNGKLALQGNRNLFGVSYMTKMEYLDLSFNHINGSLASRMFSSTPNLKYLIMVEAQLQHIQENAFAPLSDKLIFLNLSKNQLTTLAAEVIEPILQNHVGAMISLSRNNWLCDCGMQKLTALYKNHRNQFMDAAYCTAPHKLYGVSLDEVDYGRQDCELRSTTVQGPMEEKEDSPLSTTMNATTQTHAITPPMDFDSSDFLDSGETTSSESSSVFKMRCINVDSASSVSSSSSPEASSLETWERNLDLTGEADYFKFPPPAHEFDLQLIAENNSVIIAIENPTDLMIIWFSDQQEAESVTYNNKSVDYECMRYAQPHLLVGPLVENTTYTFCLVPQVKNSISPFNCLPLHVPLKRQEDIWISQDNKKFTIGMLCLIFLLSTIMGALVAYFGIKTYPDLLEGSKNVLVVKKPDQSCYVATISETEYMKQTSLKKRKPSTKEDKKGANTQQEVLKKQPSIKLPLPAIPFASPPESPPPSFHMSVRNLESLSSGISASKCFDEPFSADYFFKEENYETPRLCENEYSLEQRSVPNNYGMSPVSPPPLPKRNSNISDSPTLVMNRFSRNM